MSAAAVDTHKCVFGADLYCAFCQRKWDRPRDLDQPMEVRTTEHRTQRRPLSFFEARKIRRMWDEGAMQGAIASEIGCTTRTVQYVLAGKRHAAAFEGVA